MKVEPGQFGLWCQKGHCWLGDQNGPKTFADERLAKAAATIAAEQLGYIVRVAVIPKGEPTYKDTVETKCTPLEAIQRIEGRIKP